MNRSRLLVTRASPRVRWVRQEPHPQAPGAPPSRMILPRGRRGQVDTTRHFCPHPNMLISRLGGWSNIRVNGHPHSRRWRLFVCLDCRGSFLETHDTPFHGKHVESDHLGWTLGALAESLGIRSMACVFEADPNTVLRWWCGWPWPQSSSSSGRLKWESALWP